MFFKPVPCGSAEDASLVEQSGLGRDQQNCAARQTGTEVNILGQTATCELRVEAQMADGGGTKAHYRSGKLSDPLGATQPHPIRIPINRLTIVVKRASHKKVFEEMA